MKTTRKIVVLLSILTVLSLILTLAACSTEAPPANDTESEEEQIVFPEQGKSIRLIITHGIGGSVDKAARGMAPFLEKKLGVPVITENMEGAGGRKAMEYVFAAEPDGYTIVVSAFPSRLIGELLFPESNYKMSEFVHLGSWEGGNARVVIVAKDSPLQSFEDIMEASKTRTLKAAGGGGLGSTSQLQTVFLKEKIGLDADFIPFESTAEVASSVIGGHVDFGVQPISSLLAFADDMKAVAVHAPERSSYLPDTPTMAELGYEGVEIIDGAGAWAPPGTPEEIQLKYSQAIQDIVKSPEFLEWAESAGVLLDPLDHEEFLQKTLADYNNIEPVIPLLLEDAQ